MLDFAREGEVPVFFVDSGDVHVKSSIMTRREEAEARLKADLFLRAHERVGLDLQAVGELDLALGWPYLKELYAKSRIPLVSANIKETASGEYPFLPWKVIERGGVKVGFFSVIDEEILPRKDIREALEFEPHLPAARKAVAELRSRGVDLVVLVSHLGLTKEGALLKEVEGIDLVVGGHSREILETPNLTSGVPIVQSGSRGKRVGRLDVWLNPEGIDGAGPWGEPLEPGTPPKLRLTYRNRIDVLSKKTLLADTEVEGWVNAFKEEAANLPAMLEDEPAGGEGEDHAARAEAFWGPEVCASCHTRQAEWWSKTAHAKAYATLEEQDPPQQMNGQCVECHTLGYKDPAGFASPQKIVESLKNVSCEHCHGRGARHGGADFNTAIRDPKTCTGCHNPDNDDTWNIAKIDQIACPKMDRAPGM